MTKQASNNSIDIFPWNKNFNTGIASIDEQHKKLVQLLNMLASHIAFKSELPELNIILDELTNYTVYHFQDEEEIWHNFFPEDAMSVEHNKYHAKFISEIKGLKKQLGSSPTDEMLRMVVSFLTRWLIHHILESDQFMAKVVLALQSGLPMQAAKDLANEQMQGEHQALIDLIISIYETLSSNTLNLMREMSERKNAESVFHRLFDLTSTAMAIVEADGTLSLVNKTFTNLMESHNKNVIGRPFTEFVDKNNIEKMTYYHTCRLQGKPVPESDTFQFITELGNKGVASLNAIYLEDVQQTILSIIDMTGKNATQDELSRTKSKLLRAQKIGRIGNWTYSVPDEKIEWSEQVFVNFGRPMNQDDLNYETLISWLHHDDRDLHEAYFQKMLAVKPKTLNKLGTLQYRIKTPKNAERWMEVTTEVEFDIHKNAVLFFGTVQDITENKNQEIQIIESKNRLELITNHAPVILAQCDLDRRYTYVNQGYANLFEKKVSDIEGKYIWDIVGDEAYQHALVYIEQALSGQHVSFDLPLSLNDGLIKTLTVYYEPEFNDLNEIKGLLAAITDITERSNAEQQLRIAATVFQSQSGMMVTDSQNLIVQVNPAFTEITGYKECDVIGKNPSLLASGRHNIKFYSNIWVSINSSGKWVGEIWNKRKTGEAFPAHIVITAVKDSNGIITNYVATFTDITLHKKNTDKIKNLAFYDPLTNLPNRRLLFERLHHALTTSLRSKREGALLFIDLDNFKLVNDTLGHDIGDLLLQQVAQRICTCIREKDTVARLGGDEFVIMLEDLSENRLESASKTEKIANKVLTALNLPYQLGAHEIYNSPSIGATLFENNTSDVLLKQADIAMYQAKKEGRNTVRFYDQYMQAIITKRVTLESDLRVALREKQFQLYYQVQVDINHNPVGVEALIRWNHPIKGLIRPDDFIPLAEETGLIIPIGLWAIETAAKQIKQWEGNNLFNKFELSINVSARQFHQVDFADQVNSAIQCHGIDPTKLKLELTESILLKDVNESINTMNKLKAHGFDCYLDDFGTGYSSLQYLKKLPLCKLKIDQSFVRDITIDRDDTMIVQTIIAMAKGLELEIIAEGVEFEEQRQLLIEMGCTHFQGYLFGKAMSIEQLEAELFQLLSVHCPNDLYC